MDDIGHKNCEQIYLLHKGVDRSDCHDVMHGLKRVNDMDLIMVLVLLEVSQANVMCEPINSF